MVSGDCNMDPADNPGGPLGRSEPELHGVSLEASRKHASFFFSRREHHIHSVKDLDDVQLATRPLMYSLSEGHDIRMALRGVFWFILFGGLFLAVQQLEMEPSKA